jgi:hypothetical protein
MAMKIGPDGRSGYGRAPTERRWSWADRALSFGPALFDSRRLLAQLSLKDFSQGRLVIRILFSIQQIIRLNIPKVTG